MISTDRSIPILVSVAASRQRDTYTGVPCPVYELSPQLGEDPPVEHPGLCDPAVEVERSTVSRCFVGSSPCGAEHFGG